MCVSLLPGPKAQLVPVMCSANAEEKRMCAPERQNGSGFAEGEQVQGWGNAMEEVTAWELPV